MNKPILITTAGLDKHAYDPVCVELLNRNYEPIIYKTDSVLSQDETFNLNVDVSGDVSVHYKGVNISPEIIGAAWYRKLGNFVLSNTQDIAKNMYIHNELRHMHETIWSIYPEHLWLNSPDAIKQADRKINQLVVARESGFNIPKTYIGNSWDQIKNDFLPTEESTMIVKMIKGIVSEHNELRALYTSRLSRDQCASLEDSKQPFPGIYQKFINKAREWRVTVVGDRVFSAGIYTDEDAKVDWRQLQLTDSVRFKRDKLHEDIEDSCLRYLGKMGIKFGAFDLIETPEGETVFLECNPNGQYGWLEDSLGFNISRSIADELINIAETS